MNEQKYEQTTIHLPNGRPLSIGVPVLEAKRPSLEALFEQMYREQPRKYAAHQPGGRKPGAITCIICQQSAGTLVKVQHPQTHEFHYVHADCGRDVAAQRMNRITKLMREASKLQSRKGKRGRR